MLRACVLWYRAEAQAAAKKLLQLEKERDKYSVEAGEANARYLQVWLSLCYNCQLRLKSGSPF